jgi:nucleoside 2-deoxyribosyltransferase
VVKGKRVVYDPQDGREARPFEENGSDAEELAMVCNYGEGQKLTGEKEPEKIITCLLGKLNVKAVVLKGAWEGSIVATSSNREQIKPIPTRQVHKIGSGDIFSAEFAYHWAALGADPIEAAREANRRVAYYCERATLPIPADFSLPATPIPDLAVAGKAYDIYLAAPFFSAGQLAVVEEVRDLFSQRGATTFSPYHDVGLGNAAKVAAKDLAGIRASKFVFACLDGYDPGTVFEVGYARALNIPVIVYSPNLTQANETMFVGSGCEIIRDFTTAVYRAIWWLQSR